MITLYGTPASPFVEILIAFMETSDIEFSIHDIKPWDEPEIIFQLSPIGKVPILRTEGGDWIFETIDIANYLADHGYADGNALPVGLEDKQMLRVAHDLLSTLVLLSWEKKREKSKQDEDTIARYTRRIKQCFRFMNNALISKNEFCLLTKLFLLSAYYYNARRFGNELSSDAVLLRTMIDKIKTEYSMEHIFH